LANVVVSGPDSEKKYIAPNSSRPVASAHVQLDGPGRQARQAHATMRTAATALNLNPPGQDELASETDQRRRILTARKA
jgi:hypothetical protein